MRTSINKIIISLGLLLLASYAYSLDTTKEENTCTYIGFKKGTESFGNCVLELVDRKKKSVPKDTLVLTQSVKVAKTKPEPQAVGDGSEDDSTCQKYGFKPATNEYSSCRLQIDQAKQQIAQQQAQYNEQQRQYEEQKAAQDKQRRIQASLKLMDMGQRMTSGQNPADAYRQANGLAPLQSPTPPMQTQTYMLPNNKMMTCTTAGTVTNCF
jgi:hypothetical protein